jgi:hypothetical protein
MTDQDRARLTQLIAAAIRRHTKADPIALADTILAELEIAGHRVTPASVFPLATQLHPHVWPQFSGVEGQRSHCLVCGAAFGGARSEGPCEPHS